MIFLLCYSPAVVDCFFILKWLHSWCSGSLEFGHGENWCIGEDSYQLLDLITLLEYSGTLQIVYFFVNFSIPCCVFTQFLLLFLPSHPMACENWLIGWDKVFTGIRVVLLRIGTRYNPLWLVIELTPLWLVIELTHWVIVSRLNR